MKRSGWNPARRNKNIGTEYQGFSKNNKLVIPQKWSDLTFFWERLNNPVANTINIKDHNIDILVEPVSYGYVHSCTIDDIMTVLEYVSKHDLKEISLIVLRQPKRKEEIIKPAWGRYVYYADIGKYSGPGIYLEAHAVNSVIKRPLSLTPDQKKELLRLEEDGHSITRGKRYYYIQTNPETVRNTQLYRTLPHEIGHAADYLINSLEPSVNADSDTESDYISMVYDSKPSRDKEAFAHRYADNFRNKLKDAGAIPFSRILNYENLLKMGLSPDWFNEEKNSR